MRLDDAADRRTVGVRLQLRDVSDEQDGLDEIVDPLFRLRRHRNERRVSAVLLDRDPVLGELCLHLVSVCVGAVDLVQGDDDRDLGGLDVRDGFDCLRLDTVVRGDDEHCDVGHLGAARAHRRERLVAGRIEERHLPAVVLDLVRTDVLRDATGLSRRDVRSADRVEEARLAVVDVTEDRDDRRPFLELRRIDVLPQDLLR